MSHLSKVLYICLLFFIATLTAYADINVSGLNNGREYVDLGLPSGTMWATCNIGANYPEDYGDYYAWGEINPKSSYTWMNYLTDFGSKISNYKDCGKKKDPLRNYVYPNKKSISGTQFDVAKVKWGENWEMPTKEQWEELKQYCKWKNEYRRGVTGMLITGPNANTIFLPAAGYHDSVILNERGFYGDYWSATSSSTSAVQANILNFNRSAHAIIATYGRLLGCSIRPVCSVSSTTTKNVSDIQTQVEENYQVSSKDLITDKDDGFKYYKIYSKNRNEKIEDLNGNTLVPWQQMDCIISYDYLSQTFDVFKNTEINYFPNETGFREICFYTREGNKLFDSSPYDHTFLNRLDDGRYYFMVYKNMKCAILDGEGKIIIDYGKNDVYWLNWGTNTFFYQNSKKEKIDTGVTLTDAYKLKIYPKISDKAVDTKTTTKKHTEEVTLTDSNKVKTHPNGSNTYADAKAVSQTNTDSQKLNKKDVSKLNANGHDYVDLGLPSGARWATCNVGANKPEEFGYYFAWGEIKPKSSYTAENYTYWDNPRVLPNNFDAAHIIWGGDWRTPTIEELKELDSCCKKEMVKFNNIIGYKFTGPNGNSIFLPIAGFFTKTWSSREGLYMSSTLEKEADEDDYFNPEGKNSILKLNDKSLILYPSDMIRSWGHSIRPILQYVTPQEEILNEEHDDLDDYLFFLGW